MELEIRPAEYLVPSYSLVGDLLSYSRCKLQYRYYNRSELPPSRPVQFWFGEMLHGTLEMAYRYWKTCQDERQSIPLFPWPCSKKEWREDTPDWADYDIGKFADIVETSLQRQGKTARNRGARDAAYRRVEVAVNEIGQHLFPLITAAERKVIATRDVPKTDDGSLRRADSYEVHGIIDVLTGMNLSQAAGDNPISRRVQEVCPHLEGDFEVIVDYKGSRRPKTDEQYWEEGDWQIQTYAWLRQKQTESLPVAAGILIYINELLPGDEDMRQLRRAQADGKTDVLPTPGSSDEQLVRMWRPGTDTSQLSLEFRLARAIRVVPISDESITNGLREFDNVVLSIETDIVNETNGVLLQTAWQPTCGDEDTCNACDARWFCPSPRNHRGDATYKPKTPPAISE